MIGACTAPYLRAHLFPPRGRSFVGAFLFVEDTYNYFGYVQQAEDGAFLFRSKLAPEPQAPALVNLEWWAAGTLSRVLGRHPLLAWRLLAIAAAIPFIVLVDAWLRRCGLPASHRLPAVLLVCGGAGFGGWLALLHLAHATPLDLGSGLFPALELLANPHFVVGTSLLMAALLALSHGSRRGTTLGVALAAIAGLTRPYDMVMIVAVRAVVVGVTQPPRRWLSRLLPLAALLPVVAYDYAVFHLSRAFAGFQAARFPPPPLAAVLAALAPALALALTALRAPATDEGEWRARAHLWAWAAVGLVLIAARPVPYALQFLAGIGMPLLALGAIGLSRLRPWATVAALAVLSSAPLLSLWRMSAPEGAWFVPSARLQAARALRGACVPGDIVMAPVDIGLYALAFSPCLPFVSHPAMSGYEERLAQERAFYAQWSAQERAQFLQREGVKVLVVPAAGAFVICRLDMAGSCP